MAFARGLARLLPSARHFLSRTVVTDAPHMSFTFAAPGNVFYQSAEVKQVDVPSFSGSFGILPSHVPVLAVLKPGVVRVENLDGNSKKFFVSSGSVTVNDDSSVQVLAEEACEVSDLDVQAAKEGLANAQRDAAASDDETARAEAQISVEVHEAVIRAVEQGI